MPNRLSIAAMRNALRSKQISAVELTEAHLARISKVDPKLRAFVRSMPEQALEVARTIDNGGFAGGPLAGIPLTIKDSLHVAGQPTLVGSKLR